MKSLSGLLTITAAFAAIICISYIGQCRQEMKDMDKQVLYSVHENEQLFDAYAKMDEVVTTAKKGELVVVYWSDGSITTYEK